MSNFKSAIAVVIAKHEGGFQSRADDPGNYTPDGRLVGTKYGISAHAFPTVDIFNLTLPEAEALYENQYSELAWLEDQSVLTKVLDLAVNMQWAGHRGPAVKILQRAVSAVRMTTGDSLVQADGIFGPETWTAANGCNPSLLLSALVNEAKAYYQEVEQHHPEEVKWFANWNARAAWIPPQEAC